DKMLLLDSHMNAASKFFFGKSSLIEELVEQGVIGLGNEFNQLVVELEDMLFPAAIGAFLGESAPTRRLIGDDIAAKHIENLIKPGPRVHRHIDRKYSRTILRSSLCQ